MHRIEDAIVTRGTVVLSNLPFAEGEHVRVLVEAVDSGKKVRRSIQDVRRQLQGGVERFDDPFETLIPIDHWEMLK